KGDLELVEAEVVRDPDALHDVARRKANDADHRPRAGGLAHLVTEDLDDAAESGAVNTVALACGSENVHVAELGPNGVVDLVPERGLVELLAIVPRAHDADHDRARIARRHRPLLLLAVNSGRGGSDQAV